MHECVYVGLEASACATLTAGGWCSWGYVGV